MRAGQIVFKDLLGVVQYKIPLFQRTYDWSATQWERLWEDLMVIYDMDEPRNHFIGSVVTQPVSTIAGRVPQYVLIDGQQRMTTLLILLGAIRDKARQEPEKWGSLADEIQDLYLVNQYKHGDEKPKLVPSKRDREPFLAIVEGGTPYADLRVGQAWRYFRDKLREGDAIDLVKLKVCVTDCLDMVSITLETNDNPNRIFESLNYTGLSLNAFDLIRNYTFMSIRDPQKQDEAYEKYWYPMQEELGRTTNLDRQTRFFWRYLMMDGSLPRREREDIFNGVKREIGDVANGDESIIEALRRFHEFSNYYLQVVDPYRYGKHEQVSRRIYRLTLWGFEISYSFLMKALSYVESGKVKPEELACVAAMIESFVVRRHSQGYNLSGLRNLFAGMSANVDFENGFVESSRERLMNWRWGWPDDDRFIAGLVRQRLYVPSRLARAELVLATLELALSGKETVDLSGENITIEHIMPQKLTNEWRDALGPNADEVHSQWLHTLGNLTLTGYNSELSNMPFSDKKAILAESKFSLSSSLKNLDEWNAETIEQRGRKLAKIAAEEWPR